MPPFALLLLLLAAALHASWNLILKQTGEKYIILWWAGMATSLLALPVIWLGYIPAVEVWPLIIVSALTEVAYMATLAYAYDLSDFSLVYPIARGTAPAFLTLWSVLFLNDRLNVLGIAGLAVLVSGLLVVGSSDWIERKDPLKTGGRSTRPSWKGIALALCVALLISTYSAIDAAAVRQTPPLPYTVLVLGLTGPFFTPFLLRRSTWPATRSGLQAHWPKILAITALSLMAYGLVLTVYTFAPVSYSGAIREVSIVFAALAGWKFLNEGLGKTRVLGSLFIFCGILLISLA